jgi:hypothetical protein
MKFVSRYSNGKEVTAAQYITELICEKKAKLNKEDLHYRFWVTKKWATFYRNQIATANKLTQKYDAIAIVRALNNTKTKNMYSLRAPFFIQVIEEEEKKLNAQNTEMTQNIERKENKKFLKAAFHPKKKSIISKLKELDNE